MHQIKPAIYYEDAYLGVTLGALVFSHGTIMIDAPLRPEDARSWRAALLNLRGGSGRLLISIDAHLDRTLGARALESTIISHQKTAQIYRNRPVIFKGQGIDSGSDWETYDDVIGTRWAAPDLTFSHHMSLHWGGPEVILEHHPGPALGAIWVIIPREKVIFVGDAVTPDQPPFFSNADIPVWLETLDQLQAGFRDYTLISGRTGPIEMADVKAQQRYLRNAHKGIERLVKRNAAPEDTESLIPVLLSDVNFPNKFKEQYTQRLRSGLFHYYMRHYRQASVSEQNGLEETEA